MGGGCVSAKFASHKKKLKSYQIPQGPLCKSSKSSWPWLLAALASQPTSIAGAGCKGFNPGRGKEEEDEGNSWGSSPGAKNNRDGWNPADGGWLGTLTAAALRRTTGDGEGGTLAAALCSTTDDGEAAVR